jgi:hypothetical protein
MIDFLDCAAFDSDLPIVLHIEDIESAWFDPNRHKNALEKSGCWALFLTRLINFSEKIGEKCKIKWQTFYSEPIFLPALRRPSRCLEIIINNERLILVLSLFDQTFTVRCSNEKIIPLAILFGDEILA